MPAIEHPLIDQFLDALWLEKGLADNTRESYRSDLALFNGLKSAVWRCLMPGAS
ncbi:Tyrosine recombinase XerD [compost metagenome]